MPPRRLLAEILSVVAGDAPGDVAGARRRFAADRDAVRDARRFARAIADELGYGAAADVVELMVAELVANAVMHAESPSLVTIHDTGDALRVDVQDWGGGVLVLRDPPPNVGGGRGLRIVEAMAESWGTATTPDGKVVWFTTRAPDAEGASSSGTEPAS